MKRRHLVELEDLPWWPRAFRDAMTDYLVTAIRVTKTYSVVVPLLAAALKKSGATQVIDLCSGGGGPWPQLLPALRSHGVDVSVCLTDKYPNAAALTKLAQHVPGIRFEQESVSALDVPERLVGFRTMFTAFHHFRPADARAILASAVRQGQGIGVFEAFSRSPLTMATMAMVPAAAWLLTPAVRPFRWSRLFWTYLVPVLPLAMTFDGLVSCLRVYTADELLAMGKEVGGEAFDWEAGTTRPPGSAIQVPYLIGTPRRPT